MASRREKEKERARRESARAWAAEQERQAEPAIPSQHGIPSLAELAQSQPITEVYLCGRVSSGNQNLDHQLRGARRRIRLQDITVRRSFGDIGDGKSLDPEQRPDLFRAIAAARQRGIPLVLVTISRGIRSQDYHPYWEPDAKPSETELEEFLQLAKGVTIATLNDPDSNPPDDEAFIRQLNAEAKRIPVGRRSKKVKGDCTRRRHRAQQSARQWREDGLSYRLIADRLFTEMGISVSHETIRAWCTIDCQVL